MLPLPFEQLLTEGNVNKGVMPEGHCTLICYLPGHYFSLILRQLLFFLASILKRCYVLVSNTENHEDHLLAGCFDAGRYNYPRPTGKDAIPDL